MTWNGRWLATDLNAMDGSTTILVHRLSRFLFSHRASRILSRLLVLPNIQEHCSGHNDKTEAQREAQTQWNGVGSIQIRTFQKATCAGCNDYQDGSSQQSTMTLRTALPRALR